MHILVVEDDVPNPTQLGRVIEHAGYLVTTCDDGRKAWSQQCYAAIVLDLGLLRIDGLTLLKRWRAGGLLVPVITVCGCRAEGVEAIDMGADDSLTRPIVAAELLARLRSIIRRASRPEPTVAAFADVVLNLERRQVLAHGVAVPLGPLEFRLVSYLMLAPGRIVPRRELAEHVYAHDGPHASNALEAMIARVRKKLRSNLIETRRNGGYVVSSQGVGLSPDHCREPGGNAAACLASRAGGAAAGAARFLRDGQRQVLAGAPPYRGR